jgi:uncharacterized membrane protein YecN with MAPEG domain
MNLPVVSMLFAGALILAQMALMLAVVVARRRARQSLGDGGHQELATAIRQHGNLAENAAIFVACAALLEYAGTSRTALSVWCLLFVIGRISHVIGLSLPRNVNVLRIAGVFLTATVGIGFGVRLVTLAVTHWSM